MAHAPAYAPAVDEVASARIVEGISKMASGQGEAVVRPPELVRQAVRTPDSYGRFYSFLREPRNQRLLRNGHLDG